MYVTYREKGGVVLRQTLYVEGLICEATQTDPMAWKSVALSVLHIYVSVHVYIFICTSI